MQWKACTETPESMHSMTVQYALSHRYLQERLMQRQLVIKPLVDALFAYLKKMEPTVPTSGQLRKAYTYILNQEKYLRVFLVDGEVPIDNNASERAIREFCIGKNYVFKHIKRNIGR